MTTSNIVDDIISQRVFMPCRQDYSGCGDIRKLKAADGETIATSVVGDLNGKAVIYCHGNGENAVSSNWLWERLADRGISVVTPDYEGCGMSSGKCSEKGAYAAAYAAYDWMLNDLRKSPEDIFVLGYSLGSGVAMELASKVKIGGLLLQAAFYSGRAMAQAYKDFYLPAGIVAMASMLLPLLDSVFPSYRYAEQIYCPVLAFHGTDDRTVPYAQGKDLFDRIVSRRKQLITVKGGDHCTFQNVMGVDKYIGNLVDFVKVGTVASI